MAHTALPKSTPVSETAAFKLIAATTTRERTRAVIAGAGADRIPPGALVPACSAFCHSYDLRSSFIYVGNGVSFLTDARMGAHRAPRLLCPFHLPNVSKESLLTVFHLSHQVQFHLCLVCPDCTSRQHPYILPRSPIPPFSTIIQAARIF